MTDSRGSERRHPAAAVSLATAVHELQARMAADDGGLSKSGRRQATIALMIATAMQAFDATIANVALPQLEQTLGGGIELGAWVMTSYLCASAVTATMIGWLRRRYGVRPVFAAAIALFVAASLLCSVASSPGELVLFRLIQGSAGGIIQPLAQAMLLDIYPKADHGRILAMWGATIMVGPMMGPVLGGLITDLASWRWIFALNAPIGAFALLGLWQVPTSRQLGQKTAIDGIGILLLVTGVGALQLALERSIGRLWPPSLETIGEMAAATVALAAIAIRSRRSRFMLLRLDVFRNLNFAVSAVYNFMVGALLFTTIVFVPAMSEGPLGYDATAAGLVVSPRGIGTMATMLAIRYVIDRVDYRALLAIGLVITACALELMSWLPAHGGELWLASTSAAQGVGVGLLFTPLSVLAFSTLAPELRTDAAGVYNLSRQLGCAAGVAAMTAVLQAKIQSGFSAPHHHGGIADAASARLSEAAIFAAYTGCFRILAIGAAAMIPGILLFRTMRGEKPITTAV
jgi:MFS transporter, DHA2 family, multidrug resistance protein